eukprot:scaffold14947_cov71-Skeletonema_marinoi.AAC.2
MFGGVVAVNLNRFNAAIIAIQRLDGAITQSPKHCIKSLRFYIVVTEKQFMKIVCILQEWHHTPHSYCA